MQLLPAPGVGLLEVEVDAVEIAGEQRVAVATDRVARVGRRRVLVAEVCRETCVRRRREPRPPRRARVVGRAPRRERAEERLGIAFAAPRRGLFRAGERLAPSGDEALIDTGAQGIFDAAQRVGDARHAFGRHRPVVVGLEAHQVEALAGRLDRAPDDADVAQALTGVVLLDVERAALRHHAGREPIVVGFLRRLGQCREGFAHEVDPAGRAGGRVVGHLVVVAGNPRIGRAARIERAELVAVAIGDVEDFRHVSSSGWPVR